MKKIICLITFLFILASCVKKAAPIYYGEENCAFCGMTIVDHSHAAQLVSFTGKNYKFDASECMINYLEQNGTEEEMLYILSADYLNPGEMIDARTATFIISENISSPMGAFLSATKSTEDARELQQEYTGELFDWKNIKNEIIQKNK